MSIPKLWSNNSIEIYNPLDILYHVNPEIAALAFANKESILTPEIMPLIANFRSMQSEERKTAIRELTKKLGIEAHERETLAEISSRIDINRMSETQYTKRVDIIDSGTTERERIRRESSLEQVVQLSEAEVRKTLSNNKSAVEIEKMKYFALMKMVNDYNNGNKYISDNDYKARKFEAEAQKEVIMFVESIRSGTMREISANQINGLIKQTEMLASYNLQKTRMSNDKEIEIARINQQTTMYSELMRVECEKAKSLGIIGKASWDTAEKGLELGTLALIQANKTEYSADIKSNFGNLSLKINIK